MNKFNFSYFLNAIHYCLYLQEVWTNKKFEKITNKTFSWIYGFFFFKKFKKSYNQEVKTYMYDEKEGLSIGIAHHLFGYLYSCYPLSFSLFMEGCIFKINNDLDILTKFAILAIPIGLCYIPAYKAVLYKDRYLKYFEQFKKENEEWHKKWKRITIVFSVMSIVSFILGIASMWVILLL